MNICFVCHGYPPPRKVGGIEIFTQTLARVLVSRGHHVSIIGFDDSLSTKRVDNDGRIKVIRLPVERTKLSAITNRLFLESEIRREIMESRIDLVESPDVGGWLLLGHFGVPLVVRLHGSQFVYCAIKGTKPRKFDPVFEKNTLHLSTHLVAVCEHIKRETLKRTWFLYQPCEVIYNAVDLQLFAVDPNTQRETGRILFVGRLTETKGAPNLFKALPEIFARLPGSSLRFIGLDPIEYGKRTSDLLIKTLPVEYQGRVHIVGELSHELLPLEYRKAAVAVFPSLVEAHPIAVLEAMACGTPVVFMQSGVGPEMIENGEEGLLCDTKDPHSIAESIIKLVENPDEAQIMGAKAVKRIKKEFSLSTFVENNENFYSRAIYESKH
jgi:glycosyltransferase involved in cell wall biosynthesis